MSLRKGCHLSDHRPWVLYIPPRVCMYCRSAGENNGPHAADTRKARSSNVNPNPSTADSKLNRFCRTTGLLPVNRKHIASKRPIFVENFCCIFFESQRRTPVFRIGLTIDDSGAETNFFCQCQEKVLRHATVSYYFVSALTWPRTAVNACAHREPASPGRMLFFGPSETPGAARRQPERQSRIKKPGRKEYSDTPPLWLSLPILPTFRFGSNVLNVGTSIQRPTRWWRDATRQHACLILLVR